MLNAGQLDQRITLQSPSSSVDALGQRVETWSDVEPIWARAQPARGREFFAAGGMQGEASVVFTIRYRTGVTREMRVMWRGVPHAIVADPVDVGGARVAMELVCSAGIRDS